MSDIKTISAENFVQGEQIISKECNGNFKIVEVKPKRRWFFGSKYCKIAYKDLNIKEVAAKETVNNSSYASKKDIENVSMELDSMKFMIEDFINVVNVTLEKADRNSNDTLNKIEDALIKNGVTAEIAKSIIQDTVARIPKKQAKAPLEDVMFLLKDVLKEAINTSEGYNIDKVKKIMLVGPTGVGKTTTLAKLATIMYQNKKDVGVITLDTYKVGAITQLEEYCKILDIPIDACFNLQELKISMLKYIDKDCVLVDTTGQNQKYVDEDYDLQEMIDLFDPDQLSLVLSATTKTEDLYNCIEKFSKFDVNSLIITKMDETNTFGSVINIAYKYPNKKIVYFTNGQEVPGDIEGAKSEKIIKSIINLQ